MSVLFKLEGVEQVSFTQTLQGSIKKKKEPLMGLFFCNPQAVDLIIKKINSFFESNFSFEETQKQILKNIQEKLTILSKNLQCEQNENENSFPTPNGECQELNDLEIEVLVGSLEFWKTDKKISEQDEAKTLAELKIPRNSTIIVQINFENSFKPETPKHKPEKMIICSTHNSEATNYCEDCGKFVCGLDFMRGKGQCQNHNVNTIEEHENIIKGVLLEKKNQILEKIAKLKEMIQEISIEEDLKYVKESIQGEVTNLNSFVEKIEETVKISEKLTRIEKIKSMIELFSANVEVLLQKEIEKPKLFMKIEEEYQEKVQELGNEILSLKRNIKNLENEFGTHNYSENQKEIISKELEQLRFEENTDLIDKNEETIKCKKHKCDATHYCETCCCFICGIDNQENCQNHKFILIDQYEIKLKDILETKKNEIIQKLQLIEEYFKLINIEERLKTIKIDTNCQREELLVFINEIKSSSQDNNKKLRIENLETLVKKFSETGDAIIKKELKKPIIFQKVEEEHLKRIQELIREKDEKMKNASEQNQEKLEELCSKNGKLETIISDLNNQIIKLQSAVEKYKMQQIEIERQKQIEIEKQKLEDRSWTLDPNMKGESLTVSSNKLQLTMTGSSDWDSCVGTIAFSKGRHSWEILLGQSSGPMYAMVGVIEKTAFSPPFGGKDGNAGVYMAYLTGDTTYNMTSTNNPAHQNGDTVKCVLDCDNGTFIITSSRGLNCVANGLNGKTLLPFFQMYLKKSVTITVLE